MTESVKEVREDSEDLIMHYMKMISTETKARMVEFVKGVAFAEMHMCQESKEQNE